MPYPHFFRAFIRAQIWGGKFQISMLMIVIRACGRVFGRAKDAVSQGGEDAVRLIREYFDIQSEAEETKEKLKQQAEDAKKIQETLMQSSEPIAKPDEEEESIGIEQTSNGDNCFSMSVSIEVHRVVPVIIFSMILLSRLCPPAKAYSIDDAASAIAADPDVIGNAVIPMLKAHLASTIAHAEELYKGDPSIEAEINCKTEKLAALSVVKCIKGDPSTIAHAEELYKGDPSIEAEINCKAEKLAALVSVVKCIKGDPSTIAHAEQLYKGDPSIEAEINCISEKLAALVSVVKCIKEYGLESNYQVQPLEDQISELKMENKYKGQIQTSMAHENTANAGPLTPITW